MADTINDKTVSQTPLVISEKLDENSPKLTCENKNEIPEMLEQEIKEFEEFVSRLGSFGMKIKY